MKPRIAKNLPQHTPRKREGMDSRHLANVRLCPCLVCGFDFGDIKIEAHHLLRTEERGLSRKSSDRWAVPLSVDCHAALHRAGDEEAYLTAHGIDGRATANALWAARSDLEAMRRVIFRARQESDLTRRRKQVRAGR